MSLFSFFGKRKAFNTVDKIWMTREGSLRGISTEAFKSIRQGTIPFVVCFFDSGKQELQSFFAQQQIPYAEFGQALSAGGPLPENVIFLLGPDDTRNLPTTLPINQSLIRFFFYGHYPLILPEQLILQQLHQQTKANLFVFCLSFDHPLLQTFSSDRIKNIMEKLGLKKDECIEHAMVTKSIQRAREKIALHAKGDVKASSEKDWFERNLATEAK